jgi:hypothetical protein
MREEQGASLSHLIARLSARDLGRLIEGAPTQFDTLRTAYSGVLQQPMSIRIAYLFELGKPDWYPHDNDIWLATIEPIRSREIGALCERLNALARWYGEEELDREPNPYDAWHVLAFRLAEAHVPGFAMGKDFGAKLPGRGAPRTLTTNQTIRVAHLVYDALAAGLRDDGQISRLVRQKLGLTVPTRGCGPRKKGKPGNRPLPRTTATYLVKQIRAAWQSVVEGTATSFQFLVVFLALTSDKTHAPDWGVVFGLK